MPKGVYQRGANSKWINSRGRPEQHFWKRVNKKGPIHPTLKTPCWIWTGSAVCGYGHFRNLRAHRFVWSTFLGEIPAGMLVCHHCDTPLCVNPHHLFLGTPQDNMDDKVRKGRQKGGTKTPCYGSRNGRYVHGRWCKK